MFNLHLSVHRFQISLFLLIMFVTGRGQAAESSNNYAHPAGMISTDTVREMRQKYQKYEWAQKIIENKKEVCRTWLDQDIETVLNMIPTRRVGVYHLFTCPETKARLIFSPFEDKEFVSPKTGKVYRADEFSPVYEKDSELAGTYYDGWGCLFIIDLAEACYQSGVLYQVLEESQYAEWVSQVLLYYADEVTGNLKVIENYGGKCMLMYAREGDSWNLYKFAVAYELVRDAGFLTDDEKQRIEDQFLRTICENAIMDEEYHFDHNNLANFLGTVIQVGIAVGEPRFLEFAFGYGDYTPQNRPEHRSLAYMTEHHFLDDGAHWELCSGYHLYAASPFLRDLVMGHNLSVGDAEHFPPEVFDYFSPKHPQSAWVPGIARWVSAMAAFDGTLPTVGDSMAAKASAAIYDPFGEIAYRYCGYKELGLEEDILRGNRPEQALFVGAPEIETDGLQTSSANLSSGYAVLKRNNIYAAVNALLPGGGHQHADRLNLLIYACHRLMGMEKATPYNDLSLRDHATMSWAHNTVVIDRKSQPQGEGLKGEQIPKITGFLDHPSVGVIQAVGDGLYETASHYNRTVFSIENVVVDVFHVRGGETHDYLYHNYGESLQIDAGLQDGKTAFDAPEYVRGGQADYEAGDSGEIVNAVWSLAGDPESVYPQRKMDAEMRLHLLPSAGQGITSVFHLLTQPYEQEKPFTHTFLARRTGPENTFVAIYEPAFADEPSCFVNGESKILDSGACEIELGLKDQRILLAVNQGQGNIQGEQLETDGVYAAIVFSKSTEQPVLIVLGFGTYVQCGETCLEFKQATSCVATRGSTDQWSIAPSAPIQMITKAAGDEYPPMPLLRGKLTLGAEDKRLFVFEQSGQQDSTRPWPEQTLPQP